MHANNQTILVVDDEPDMLENLIRLLGRKGYRCLAAQSAIEAIGLITRERPDLVITDLYLPGMDGLEITQHAQTRSPAIPVVLVTANASAAAHRQAFAAGAFFLAKPFVSAELLALVQRALGNDGSS
jgi:two-component system response regulator GlrR